MDKKIEKLLKEINSYLKKCLGDTGGMAKEIENAMRYAVFPGGKRIRPLLVLSVARIARVPLKKILPAACGIELIHCFSLVHDDLPCMDNDDFRRGKPSCHKKFGEAQALLAGDALLCLGIREIAKCGTLEAVIRICDALGSNGMAGGQSLDMIFKNKQIPKKIKIWIDRKKTGELFSLCFEIPALVGKCKSAEVKRFREIGSLFGESFQILDDLKDREGDEKQLMNNLHGTVKKLLRRIKKLGKNSEMLLHLCRKIFGSFVDI